MKLFSFAKAYREGCGPRWDAHQETATWQGLAWFLALASIGRDPKDFQPWTDILKQITRSEPVPKNDDWKQKYRDSLLEAEAEEKRWREIEQVLRRLIGRLCAAAMGVDPQLDDELSALAAANRRNAGTAELERFAAAVTMAIVAPHAVSPVPPIFTMPVLTRWESTIAATGKILQHLRNATADDAAPLELIAK